MKYDRRPAPKLDWLTRMDCIAAIIGYATFIAGVTVALIVTAIHWSN